MEEGLVEGGLVEGGFFGGGSCHCSHSRDLNIFKPNTLWFKEGLKPNPLWFQKELNQFEQKSGCFVLMFKPPLTSPQNPPLEWLNQTPFWFGGGKTKLPLVSEGGFNPLSFKPL